jgi:rfaE bifunctional protein nucleotidyltransferase chain/domain
MGKIVTKTELIQISEDLHKNGIKIVTTNGAFDILHPGHLDALKNAKQLGDHLIVGLNSDASVRRYKDPRRPANPEAHRAQFLSMLPWVDTVYIFDETDANAFIEMVKPDIHVKSGDYTPEKILEKPVIDKCGAKLVITPFLTGYSTTSIIERILKAYGRE